MIQSVNRNCILLVRVPTQVLWEPVDPGPRSFNAQLSFCTRGVTWYSFSLGSPSSEIFHPPGQHGRKLFIVSETEFYSRKQREGSVASSLDSREVHNPSTDQEQGFHASETK